MPRRTKRDPYARAVDATMRDDFVETHIGRSLVRRILIAAAPYMPLPREVAALVRAARRWNDGGSTGTLFTALAKFAGTDRAAKRRKGKR